MGNREKLLAAAEKCLFEKGYGQTTVRDIAGEAGVSMAAIGYHFGSKEALLNAALFAAMDDGPAAMGAESTADAATEPEDYRRMWTEIVGAAGRHRTFWLASFEAMLQAQRDPELREQLAQGLRMGRSGLAHRLTGVPESELSPEVVNGLGSVQLALLGGIMVQLLTDPDDAPDVDDILTGLKALAERLS